MDLRHSLIPDELIDDLLHSMPKHTGPDLEVDRHLPKYDYISFMTKMAGGDTPLSNGHSRENSKSGISHNLPKPRNGTSSPPPLVAMLSPASSPKKENRGLKGSGASESSLSNVPSLPGSPVKGKFPLR